MKERTEQVGMKLRKGKNKRECIEEKDGTGGNEILDSLKTGGMK